MKQILINQGIIEVKKVPAPSVEKGKILVKVVNSCISSGTELSMIKGSGIPLWKRAINDPKKAIEFAKKTIKDGISESKSTIQNVLQSDMPIGYSNSGYVIAVGDGISNVKIGDRVACAGAQCAFHAEIVSVPMNLFVKIPKNVSFADASTVALGAIALQGVRRVEPTLGEFIVVVGLGILGQLTVQLLKANGCTVAGIDPNTERLEISLSTGLDFAVKDDVVSNLQKLTNGQGVDAVIITAATSSESVLKQAFQMCRKKARVILVGSVPINIDRNDIYVKELDFKISSSYGPGRYDEEFEEKGLKYPIGHVRWTETRNMDAYLNLIEKDKLNLELIKSPVFPIEEAICAYDSLNQLSPPLLTLIEYSDNVLEKPETVYYSNHNSKIKIKDGKLRIALIGAGNYAKNIHLPNLKNCSDKAQLYAVCSRTGYNANEVAKLFNANYSTTSIDEILSDKNIDAVIITTRHNQHANLALQSLKSGKHVLVEKPLALTQDEIEEIKQFYNETPHGPVLLTGFNRRFSSHLLNLKELLSNRTNPIIINYQMNAGYIPNDSWIHGTEGGGRNKGEACHIYDLFTFLTDAKVIKTTVNSLNPTNKFYKKDDNFIATFSFDDGSIANLLYTSLGHKYFSKEKMDVFFDGKVVSLDDYRKSVLISEKTNSINTKKIDKGQPELLSNFIEAALGQRSWPIELWHQIQATEMAIEVEKHLAS
ncbi:MAG: oxidoreductase [Flavobacteriaceae bacterium]|nr:oxidoreductase [Flavobacteriaceae bacterium]